MFSGRFPVYKHFGRLIHPFESKEIPPPPLRNKVKSFLIPADAAIVSSLSVGQHILIVPGMRKLYGLPSGRRSIRQDGVGFILRKQPSGVERDLTAPPVGRLTCKRRHVRQTINESKKKQCTTYHIQSVFRMRN